MQYIMTFLEGVISFISPCMLPMLPVYLSYFAGNADKKSKVFLRAFAFVLGFTVVFTAMGLFAGTLGAFLAKYRTAVNIVSGAIVVVFGLSYLEVIRIPFFRGGQNGMQVKNVFSAFLFGVIYSVSLTPCVGAFLGSALMMASQAGSALMGTMLLLTYSLGLGIPFLFSAVLIDKMSGTFGFIKRNYKVINLVCGIILIVVGVLMMLGLMNMMLAVFV